MSQAPRIVLRRQTRWPDLHRQIQRRGNAEFAIAGKGARAKAFILRVGEEYPGTIISRDGRGQYTAIVNPTRPDLFPQRFRS